MDYTTIIKNLETHLFSLHPQAQDIYIVITGLKSLSSQESKIVMVNDKILSYDERSNVTDKIIFALRALNKFSKVVAIEKAIKQIEPTFNKGFSTPLTKLKQDGKIISLNPSGSMKDVYYGLPEWMNENGTPSNIYLDEDLIFLY